MPHTRIDMGRNIINAYGQKKKSCAVGEGFEPPKHCSCSTD